MNLRSFALLAVVGLAACSGGGGGGSTPPVPGGSATATPAPQPTGATASLAIAIPLAAAPGSSDKRPAYVSPSTSTLRVQINTVNGAAPPAWVPTDVSTTLTVGGNCTVSGGTQTCTVPVAAPAGVVNYTFTAGDGTHALSALTTDETMVLGTVNNIGVTLQGIVAGFSVSGATLVANAPPASRWEALSVSAFDADNHLIVSPGNYYNPITVTDNDPTGVTGISTNDGTNGSTTVVNSPGDAVALYYDGHAVNNITFNASAAGVSAVLAGVIVANVNDITFTGTTFDDAAHGGLSTDPNWGQQTVFFSQASGTQTFSAAELGWTNAPYYTQAFNAALSTSSNSCSGIATISAGPATSFTVTAVGVGVCSGRLTENGTGYPITGHPGPTSGSPTKDGHFWISVTSSSFGINHSKR